jgi:Fe-S cluster biogenesis protein NfuA
MTDLNDVIAREELKDKIEKFVDDEIRPFLHSDGGDLEILDLQATGILRVMLQGACSSCVSSIMTLKFGVERRLMEVFPEITGVELAGLIGSNIHLPPEDDSHDPSGDVSKDASSNL